MKHIRYDQMNHGSVGIMVLFILTIVTVMVIQTYLDPNPGMVLDYWFH